MADERGSDSLEPRDALAGIYIAGAEFDGLLRYWKDPGGLERLLQSECGTLNPRLFYWFWWAKKRSGKSLGQRFSFGSRYKKISPELETVEVSACDFASRRPRGSGKFDIVVPEDILLAMVRLGDLPISKKLLDSGLDVAQLERQVGSSDSGRAP